MKRRKLGIGIVVIIVLIVALVEWNIISHKRKNMGEKNSQLQRSATISKKSLNIRIKDIFEFNKALEKGEDVFEPGLKLARDLVQKNKYLEAKKIYKELIQKFSDHPKISQVEKELWDLNIKILFSPVKTDYSLIYEVKPGDTLEAIAKKFNTTVGLIKRSNGLSSDLIRPGQHLKVINARATIIVDKSQNTLTLKINDEIIKVYRCSTGKFNSTPTGEFKIVNKLINPVWFKTGAVIPPDSPENILGSRWMGFNLGGYGIHGTTDPKSIGKQITAGCIRLRNRDVEELYDIVPLGTKVIIID